uniref:BHLH domain-containing protein n=1 Tax=Mola mola TaxID=94237 RepID=A0A3Q3W505_MOLML
MLFMTKTATPSRKLSKAARDFAGESGSDVKKISPGQRRERHNRKERERRRRIRSYCDELNMLVPFCQSTSGMLATLQWTTAFLKYINDTYGDTLKESFGAPTANQIKVTSEKNLV